MSAAADLIVAVVLTASLLECGVAIILAHHTTVEFKCTTNGDHTPDWFVNGKLAVTAGDSYRSRTSNGGDITTILTIDGNGTQVTFNIHCEVYVTEERQFLRVYGTMIIFQGFLDSPENVFINSSTIEWKPPYFSLNNDTVHVDPHITQYTVYITDNYTGDSIVEENVTETQYTFNIQDNNLCPTYQVSAWNAGGEGELSEPVQDSSPQVPHSIAVENISLTLEPDVVHIHIDVDATCVSRMAEFFLITLMTSTGIELNMTHELEQENANYTISLVSLPQNVDICTTLVRISAGNSAGVSTPSEAVEVVCSGGSTEFQTTTAVSTMTTTMGTESGNRQQEGSTTLIAITTGVIVAIGGALIGVVIGIICYRKYKNRRGKGHIDNNYSESPSLGGPVPLYPSTAAPDVVYVNSEQTTGRRLARDSESTAVWSQSSDTATSPSSTDSAGSNDPLLQPTPPVPVGSPHPMYAQLEVVKQTQVQPPANDDPVQYAQIEHQD